MSCSTSRLAYADAYDCFDQALDSKTGIRIAFRSRGEATYFRMRLHQARSIDRQDNAKLYETDHQMHGRSSYDPIQLKLRQIEDKWYVYLELITGAGKLKIEPIEEEVPENTFEEVEADDLIRGL
jgi:hypothetical protein